MQQLTDAAAKTSPDLGLTMTQVLRDPLAALRAAMEAFAGNLHTDDPRASTLHSALEQVLAMSRDVEALIDWTKPRGIAPLLCTTDEILHGIERKLPFEHAARVHVVNDACGRKLFVDATILGDSLHWLLRGVLSSGSSDVLLRATSEADATTFSLVQQAPNALPERNPDTSSERERLVTLLGSELARRDIERCGCKFAIERTDLGNIRVTVRIDGHDGGARA